MIHPEAHNRDRAVRILFVFASLDGGPEEAQMRFLAQALDPARFRIDALPCVQLMGAPDPTHRHLQSIGIHVDCTAYTLGFEETVQYLARKISGYEILISCQDVADIYPALECLRHRPPLIEYSRFVTQALAGPKYLTTRYVGASDVVRDAAASRMEGRPQDARLIAPVSEMLAVSSGLNPILLSAPLIATDAMQPCDIAARDWSALFDEVLAETSAPPPSLFRSFMQGGFECSTQRLQSGRRLDVVAATAHDNHAEGDYRQLARLGLRTLRDGARWHLIERNPKQYDFSSFLPMVRASHQAGSQVIWDLLHYGWPDDIDIWHPSFVDRFAAFARAIGQLWKDTTDQVPFWCPVNEISFFSWAAGDARYLNPFASGRGFELKVQLARASISAMHALRDLDRRARFAHCEPLIAIHHDATSGLPKWEAEGWHEAQFQTFELLSGRMWPQIGGDPSFLDIVGVNYYPNNQWLHGGASIDVDHAAYRPLSDLLFEIYSRYQRPVFVAETGVEDDRRAPWLTYVAAEVARARRRGIPVEGLCLYPIMNHPGWDDDRDCHNGLLTQHFLRGERGMDAPLSDVLSQLVAAFG